jgi:hypothetical protein
MQKRNAAALSEILYQDINKIGDYTEDFQQWMFNKVLDIPSGVVHGLAVSQNGASGFNVATGSLIDSTFAFGELEAVSGVTLDSLPTGAVTRYDIVSARYLEQADSPGASYVLIDVESRTQSTQNVYRRNFGSVVIANHEDTTSGALTGNRMPLAQLTVTSGGIQSITDLRTLVKPRNVDTSEIDLGGDLSGTAASATVVKIQNIDVDTTDPTNKQVLVYDSGSAKYIPSGAAAYAIKDLPVSGAPSASGQELRVNSGQTALEWHTPTATTSVAMGGDVTGDSDNATVQKINGTPITGSFNAGELVLHNGSEFVGVSSGSFVGSSPTRITYSNTSQSIAAGATFTATIPIGVSGKTFGIAGFHNMVAASASGSYLGGGVSVHFTDAATGAVAFGGPVAGDSSSTNMFIGSTYARSNSGTLTGYGIFDGINNGGGNRINLVDCYISGTDLIVTFQNRDAAPITLSVFMSAILY